MVLSFFLFLALCVNTVLAWNIVAWIGVGVFFVIFFVWVLIALFVSLWVWFLGMIFGKYEEGHTGWRQFFRYMIRWWWWLVILICISPWFLYSALLIFNDFSASTLPKITLTNGDKTLIFQSMSHIGSEEFYTDIQEDMRQLKTDDYVFFYEWVKRGSDESVEKLSQLMGMELSEDMYVLMAQLGWFVQQDVQMFSWLLPSTNVDLDTDEMMLLAQWSGIQPPKNLQFMEELKKYEWDYDSFTSLQKRILQEAAHALMNLLLMNYADPELERELIQAMPLMEIILHTRNTLLVDTILESPSKNIYIHYGALHYAGILAGLQERDPRWHEVHREFIQLIR